MPDGLPPKVFILTPSSAEAILRVVRNCAVGMVHEDSRARAKMSADITEKMLPALKLVFAEANLTDINELRAMPTTVEVGNGTGKLHG